jgi:type VI secretion system secreted protein VgrG
VSILELSFACGEASLAVHRFSVKESVSSLFTVSIVARSPCPDLDIGDFLGRPAALHAVTGYAFAHLGGARRWAGVCSWMELARSVDVRPGEVGPSTYRLTLVPALWLLTHRRNHRIYQHLSVPEIVTELLAGWEIEADWRIDAAQHPRREYAVQHGESDYDFLSRLLEEAGIAFTLPDVAERSSRPVFCDALHMTPARPAPPLPFVDNPNDAAGREIVTSVRLAAEVRPGAIAIRDHDFRNPAYPFLIEARAGSTAEGRLEQHRYHPGAFLILQPRADGRTPAADDRGVARHDARFAAARAARTLLAERTGARIVQFRTNAIDLQPGTVFSMDHPHPALDASHPLLVLSFSVRGTPNGAWIMRGRAVPADQPYHPPLRTPKPRIDGVDVARVVGPKGQEIHTDEHGRIRVQFMWDREGQSDDRSSCWIRVGSPWAGPGYGLLALPRVGQEVIVSFVGGDPDQPLATGGLFNALNPVPVRLPEHKTQSVWRSATTPGGDGFNQILFEDKKGDELVSLQAQRDLRALVKNDEAIAVGRDSARTIRRNETTIVGESATRLVRADETQMTGGTRAEHVAGDHDVIVQQVKRELVEQDVHQVIEGELRAQVDGPCSITTGDQHHRVAGDLALKTDGDLHLTSSTAVVIDAPDITLAAGGSVIRMNAAGITIDGVAVKINEGGTPRKSKRAKPKTPQRPKPPKDAPRMLTIKAWSAFTTKDHPKPRRKLLAENVIIGANAFILDQARVSKKGTDKNTGETKLNIAGLNGEHVLRLVPAAHQLSPGPAGFKTGSRDAKRMYQTLDIVIHLKDGKLDTTKPPFVPDGVRHGRVLNFTEDSIEVDWKPAWVRAPRVSPRPEGTKVTAIVIHRTSKDSIASALSTFLNEGRNSHFLIDVDGHTVKLTMEDDEASHVGEGSQWKGEPDVNSFSIGIELVNGNKAGREKNDKDAGTPFPPEQIQAAADLIETLMEKLDISRHRVLAHAEVRALVKEKVGNRTQLTNNRAYCPGYEFDWPALEQRGLASRPSSSPTGKKRSYEAFFDEFPNELLMEGNEDDGSKYGTGNHVRAGYRRLITQLHSDLQDIGYESVPANKVGEYTEHTFRLVERFQARYCTAGRKLAGLPGRLDQTTAIRIREVLEDRKQP